MTGTDAEPDFGSFVATPGAASYESGRDDVDDDSEDQRSRQRKKSVGEASTTRNLEVAKNLLAEFLDALDRRREAGKPENALESWKEASLILHAEENISEDEEGKEEEKKEKKEKKKEVSFKEEQKGRRERKREKEEEERRKEDKMKEDRRRRDELQRKKSRDSKPPRPHRQ